MDRKRVGALILTAGLSSRMEGFKPLLTIGEKTLIERAIGLFTTTGIEEIVTVVGHRAEELIPVVAAASSRYVLNKQYRDGMFSSIQRGAQELEHTCDAFFLLPVDIPLVRPATIKQLLDAWKKDASALVCYPQFQSRRGHPPLIDSSLADHINTYNGHEGMRGFLRRYEDRAIVIPVADPFIQMDADTREDLSLLRRAYLQGCVTELHMHY